MFDPLGETLSKEERLCGKTAVDSLLSKGRWGYCGHLRYCFLADNGLGHPRLLVSVPKKFFKRAVMRNLLKRRMREAFRLQKKRLEGAPVDLMLVYNSDNAEEFAGVRNEVETILTKIK